MTQRATWAVALGWLLSQIGCGADEAPTGQPGSTHSAGATAVGDGGGSAGGTSYGGGATGGSLPHSCGFSDLAAATILVDERYVPNYGNPWTWQACVDGWFWSEPRSRVHGISPFHRVAVQEGSCRYLELAYDACDEPCGPGEMCTAEGSCMTVWAQPLGAGALTITTAAGSFEVQPGTGSGYLEGFYQRCDLPVDLFQPGDLIQATVPGDEFPAVPWLSATGVAPIDTDLAGVNWPMHDGQDAQIEWTAGADPNSCVEVIINGHNAAHGTPLDGIIHCVGPDSGTMVVPQAVVEAFPDGAWQGSLDSGVSCEGFDCVPSELSRFTGSVIQTGLGPVELRVRSVVYFGWSHLP